MENAKLGDAMIEKLRAHGTSAEKEKHDAMERLQQQAMALKSEQEEKMKLMAEGESIKASAAEAIELAKKKEAELTAMMAEVQRRKEEVDAQAGEMQAAIEERAAALAGASAEYNKLQAAILSTSTAGGEASEELQARARSLEDEKLRLQQEKATLEVRTSMAWYAA